MSVAVAPASFEGEDKDRDSGRNQDEDRDQGSVKERSRGQDRDAKDADEGAGRALNKEREGERERRGGGERSLALGIAGSRQDRQYPQLSDTKDANEEDVEEYDDEGAREYNGEENGLDGLDGLDTHAGNGVFPLSRDSRPSLILPFFNPHCLSCSLFSFPLSSALFLASVFGPPSCLCLLPCSPCHSHPSVLVHAQPHMHARDQV